MKCAYHPDKEAVTTCSSCKKALCEDCTAQTENNEVCIRCAARAAAQDASVEANERIAKHQGSKAKGSGGQKKGLSPLIIILIVFTLIVLLANAYMYVNSKVAVVPEFNPNEDLEVTAVFISEGISRYMADHGGDLPEHLDVLYGGYLTEENISPDVLKKFAYIIRSDGTYLLRLKGPKQTRFPDMVFEKSPS